MRRHTMMRAGIRTETDGWQRSQRRCVQKQLGIPDREDRKGYCEQRQPTEKRARNTVSSNNLRSRLADIRFERDQCGGNLKAKSISRHKSRTF